MYLKVMNNTYRRNVAKLHCNRIDQEQITKQHGASEGFSH